ncbi:hypothetical protein B0H11DRAFT_1915256 [Mycena galericulata]|nr:hypothetical protein B0H11DRAFT_1915256 [Mycena galericulata]
MFSSSFYVPELLSSILEEVCGLHCVDFVDFCRQRATLSLVCCEWLAVVNSVPALWTWLVLSERIEPWVVSLWMDRPAALLDVYVIFESVCTDCARDVDVSIRSKEVAEVLASKADRLRRLEVYADNVFLVQCITSVLEDCTFLNLGTLSICASNSQSRSRLTEANFPRMLRGSLPALVDLTLYSVMFPLPLTLDLSKIEFLRLGSMARSCYPSWNVYRSIFVATTGLRSLSLSATGCANLPRAAWSQKLELPVLEELVLIFIGRSSVAKLVNAIRTPRLRLVGLSFDRWSDILNALACLSDRGDLVEELRVQCVGDREYPLTCQTVVAQFYRCMRRVHKLDLTDAHPIFFQWILRATAMDREFRSPQFTCLPLLQCILLPSLPIMLIKDLVFLRLEFGKQWGLRQISFEMQEVMNCSGAEFQEHLSLLQSILLVFLTAK